MAVAALVLGIVGFVLGWIPFLGYIPPILAIIFGIIGRKDPGKKGMAISGLILGIVALVVWKLGFWFLVIIGALSG